MKVILPDSVRIMDLLKFAEKQGLEVRKGSGPDLVFQERRASNVRSFPRPAPKPTGPSAA